MIYSNPDQIGILACPGGEEFANKLIARLEKISIKKKAQAERDSGTLTPVEIAMLDRLGL